MPTYHLLGLIEKIYFQWIRLIKPQELFFSGLVDPFTEVFVRFTILRGGFFIDGTPIFTNKPHWNSTRYLSISIYR